MPSLNSCKICKSTTEIINDYKLNKKFYFCKNCNFIFLDNEFIIDEKSEKKRYLLHQNNFNEKNYVDYLQKFIDESIIPFKKNIYTALDFGCGMTPVLSELLNKMSIKTVYYDKYFFPDKSYNKNKYDLITITEVLEHLSEPVKTLKSLIKLLNSEGIISIMTLYHPNNIDLFLKWWYKNDITHITFYTKKTMQYISDILKTTIIYDNNKNICILKKKM